MLSFPKLQADEWEIFVLLFIQSGLDANWKPINSSNFPTTVKLNVHKTHNTYYLPMSQGRVLLFYYLTNYFSCQTQHCLTASRHSGMPAQRRKQRSPELMIMCKLSCERPWEGQKFKLQEEWSKLEFSQDSGANTHFPEERIFNHKRGTWFSDSSERWGYRGPVTPLHNPRSPDSGGKLLPAGSSTLILVAQWTSPLAH